MRIQVLSDLHNEFAPFVPPKLEADVVVLAGDIDIGKKGVRWSASAFGGRPVIYVPGNHEYYGHAIPKLTLELQDVGRSLGVRVLDCATATIEGVSFLGCTLWSDFEIAGNRTISIAACAYAMTDFRRIRVSPTFRRLRPLDQAGLHLRAVRWLAAEIPQHQRTVVVTHHAPSGRSLRGDEPARPVDGAYASDLDAFVAASGAAVWIHGHTHRCVDYVLGSTRVVSNPRGYVDDPVSGFSPGLVVEV